MSSDNRRGVALATGSVAGLALATIVLPQIAGSLRPTALGIGLLTLALGLSNLAAQRLGQCYRRRSELETAVRDYPPPLLGTQNLDALGVYPLPPTDAASYQARPRSEDERLAKAMTTSCCVVVHGGPRVGKSHAAARAAGESLGDIPVIVPFDADGLRALQDNCFDARLRSRATGECVSGSTGWIALSERSILASSVAGRVARSGSSDGPSPAATAISSSWPRSVPRSGTGSWPGWARRARPPACCRDWPRW
ncbi:MAG: hypothetical protein QOF83_2701 [Solirubrobacteraceae bacterium]|nr:hypothetical protein [Solirubrobacteraceae bacterium]